MVIMSEIPHDAHKDLIAIFGEDTIKELRREYKNNCLGLAEKIKYIFNYDGILAEILVFKSGHTFNYNLKVNGEIYTHHAVVLMGDWVIDLLHTTEIIKTKDYIMKLKKDNPELRLDKVLTTGWYNEQGYAIPVTLDYLIKYKY